MKTIIVNATAATSGGALSILKQCLEHAKEQPFNFIFFVSSDDLADIYSASNIVFINPQVKAAWRRIYWDFGGLRKFLKQNKIHPDLFISLQNTAAKTDKNCPKIIYLHQSLPISSQSWRPWIKEERSLWFYKNIYPLFMKLFLTSKTSFVCQGEWMVPLYAKLLRKPVSAFSVFKPINNIDNKIIEGSEGYPQDSDKTHFDLFYPANSAPYKNHICLIEALALLKKQRPMHVLSIRLLLTISVGQVPSLDQLIREHNLTEQVILLGMINKEEVDVYYQKVDLLVFPSTIETFGLPLLEAAQFGLPIVCSDLPYAREVLQNYSGATFIHPYSIKDWTNTLNSHIKHAIPRQPRYQPDWPDWHDFFNHIQDKIK